MIDLFNNASAILSDDRQHRYSLIRTWDHSKPVCVFIGLNPSTADESEDDPTIRRCVNFAAHWDCGELVMLNLFTIRATDPKLMKSHKEPNRSDSDSYLVAGCMESSRIILAWGNHGSHLDRDKEVIALLRKHCPDIPVYVFGLTKSGQPKHPLYLANDSELIPFSLR